MHHAHGAIAGVDLIDHDAQAIDIDDLGQRRALALHLSIDAIQMLFARLDLGRDAGLLQRRLELHVNLVEKFLLIAAGALERALDDAIALRVESLEAEFLELQLHGVEPEPLGHRRVDIERLARHLATLGWCHGTHGAQVVGAIGELDQDHAQIAHHRQQHLAKALGLRFLAILELDLIEFGDAIDNLGDIIAKTRRDLGFRRRRVFDDIVQNRRDDGVGVEVQVSEDVGRRHRMRDVGFAAEAFLSLMCRGAKFCRGANALDLLGGQVAADFAQQLLETRSASGAGE